MNDLTDNDNVRRLQESTQFQRVRRHVQGWTPALFIFIASLQGCASLATPASSLAASPIPESAALSKDGITIENLLRWPLEGSAGADRLRDALNQLFAMKSLRASQFSGDGPVRLADGYVLDFVLVRTLSDSIDIGLKSEPCLPPKQIVEITGAIQEPGVQDAHSKDIGQSFKTSRNGITVRMDTTPTTYKCVTTLHVHPAQKD